MENGSMSARSTSRHQGHAASYPPRPVTKRNSAEKRHAQLAKRFQAFVDLSSRVLQIAEDAEWWAEYRTRLHHIDDIAVDAVDLAEQHTFFEGYLSNLQQTANQAKRLLPHRYARETVALLFPLFMRARRARTLSAAGAKTDDPKLLKTYKKSFLVARYQFRAAGRRLFPRLERLAVYLIAVAEELQLRLEPDEQATAVAETGKRKRKGENQRLEGEAIKLLVDHPDWKLPQFAEALGVPRTSLYHLHNFLLAYRASGGSPSDLPGGYRTDAGGLEAFMDGRVEE
jgi:hypothetical protein